MRSREDQIDLSLSYNRAQAGGLRCEPVADEVLYFIQGAHTAPEDVGDYQLCSPISPMSLS